MTTGRINQVARPPRQTDNSTRTMRLLSQPSFFREYHISTERGAEAASPYSVSSIRDQEHKRGDLGGTNQYGRYHEVTPQVLYSRSATPKGWAQHSEPVANATSRGTGSSTQALVRGASMMPAQLRGHWRRESAALGRGASKQSQVHHNSYASVARRSSHPKHPTTLGMASLLARTAAEGPQSVGTNKSTPSNDRNLFLSIMAGCSQPRPAAANQQPTAARTGRPKLANGRPQQAAGRRGTPGVASASQRPATAHPRRPQPTNGHWQPATAGRSQPPSLPTGAATAVWPAAAA